VEELGKPVKTSKDMHLRFNPHECKARVLPFRQTFSHTRNLNAANITTKSAHKEFEWPF
jgi:hypothetical protein